MVKARNKRQQVSRKGAEVQTAWISETARRRLVLKDTQGKKAIGKTGVTGIPYLLTPWGRVLLEKLTGFAASQEIPRIYGNRKFIAVFTSARHLSLS